MRVVATRSPAGDLVIIATDFGVWETWKLDQLRWSVECTFSSIKARGFDLERTGVTQLKRLEHLTELRPPGESTPDASILPNALSTSLTPLGQRMRKDAAFLWQML